MLKHNLDRYAVMALLCLIFKTGFVRKDMYQDFDTLYGQVNVLPWQNSRSVDQKVVLKNWFSIKTFKMYLKVIFSQPFFITNSFLEDDSVCRTLEVCQTMSAKKPHTKIGKTGS